MENKQKWGKTTAENFDTGHISPSITSGGLYFREKREHKNCKVKKDQLSTLKPNIKNKKQTQSIYIGQIQP